MMCTWRNRQSIQVLHIIMSGKKKRKSLTHHVEGGAGLENRRHQWNGSTCTHMHNGSRSCRKIEEKKKEPEEMTCCPTRSGKCQGATTGSGFLLRPRRAIWGTITHQSSHGLRKNGERITLPFDHGTPRKKGHKRIPGLKSVAARCFRDRSAV